MKVAVVGRGKAGGSLLASLRKTGVDVVATTRRLPFRGARWQSADLVVLAVPDDAIEEVARALPSPLPRGQVVHMSGARGALGDIGSFHPLASLDGKRPIPAKTLFALDGGDVTLERLAKKLGGVPVRVPADQRARYHAGAVIAGNLPVALLAMGIELLVEAGVPEDVARVSLARLLRSQAENAERAALPAALSGPIARGDVDTLRRHLAVLSPQAAATYRALSQKLIDVRKPKAAQRLRAALRG